MFNQDHKSISFRIAIVLILIAGVFGVIPAQAEPLARPLYASGDFVWAKSMGGTSGESGNSIALDSSGNVYTTGYFSGTVDFDPGAGTSNLTTAGSSSIFVSKLDSSGNFIWARNIGGTGYEYVHGLALDSVGNVYITGYFLGTVDFDPGAGTSSLTSAGTEDIFVSKLDSNGNFVWAKRIGGTSYDNSYSIALDSSGNVYTTGSFGATVDFDPGTGTSNLISAGFNDIFISKLDSNGNFVWAKRMGGPVGDAGSRIALDSSGNVYTTGTFGYTVDFDPGAGTSNLTTSAGMDWFVSKLDSNGNFVWAKNTGGDIALDSSGNVYTTAIFTGTVDFDPGAGTSNLTSAGLYDIFVSKLDSSGNFVWVKRMGGTDYDYSKSIVLDSSGNVYTTGYFLGTADFDPGAGTSNLTSEGTIDIFVSKLDSNGSFVWAKRIGGTSTDYSYSIALDSSGDVYIIGEFFGTVDFDPGAGISNLTSAGLSDIFVNKLDGGVRSITGNAGVAGATMSYINGTLKTTVSQSNGSYSISVPYGWSGIVTPSLGGVTFTPPNRNYFNVTANQTEQNYAASVTLTGNVGVAGGTLSYFDNTPKAVTADGSWNYTITVPWGWSGTVTPYKTGYTFAPVSKPYSNLQSAQTSQNYTASTCVGCADVQVTMGGNPMGGYTLASGQERRENYPVSAGPVVVHSTNAVDIVSAIRLQSYVNNTLYSFLETMGVPSGLLSYKYYFPTYNNTWAPLNSQIRFGNLAASATTVRVTIGGHVVWEQSVPGQTEQRLNFNVSGGPVIVESLDPAKKIIAAIRLQSYADNTLYSFAETMGIPVEKLSDTYYFPTYNNTWAPLNSQLRVGNLDANATTVRVTIGGNVVWEQSVPGLTEQRLNFNVSGGPVKVESLDPAKKIVAAIRLQSYADNTLYSFVETMGVPSGLLSYKYYFPTYNNTWAPLNSQIRFGNLDASATTVRVTIGGHVVWEQSVPGLTEQRLNFNVSGGPVIVESLDPAKQIIAAIRLQSYAGSTLYSFAETMGIAVEQLSDTYYFPTYNNTWGPLNSQLRFGMP